MKHNFSPSVNQYNENTNNNTNNLNDNLNINNIFLVLLFAH